MKTTEITTSNSLKFSTSKKINFEGKPSTIYVQIRLNDECKNGHQDFSITGGIYGNQNGIKTDRSHLTSGCIHEEISQYFPEFKNFVDLHSCDYNGVPMYAVENGFFHLKEGFSNLKGKTQKEYFCDYYRVTGEQYDKLLKSENPTEYAILLRELGVLNQWQKEADNAIKVLEGLTGTKFLIDSVRSQYKAPSEEEIKTFEDRKANGYYSDDAKAERMTNARKLKIEKMIEYITETKNKKVKDITEDAAVKIWLINKIEKTQTKREGLKLDFEAFTDNSIYYNHTNKIGFNWKGYGKKVTKEQFQIFCDSLTESDFDKLPNGISFELDKEVIFKQ